jgi:hypothetical protein
MCGGGGGGIVSDFVSSVGDAFSGAVDSITGGVSDLISGAGDALASIDPGPAIGDALASVDPGPAIGEVGAVVDQAVNDVIPGGWGTVGAAALAAVTYGGSLAAEGAIEAGSLAADAGWSAAEAGAAGATEGAVDTATADALASGEISGLTSGATDATLAQGTMDASTIANMSADPIDTLNALNNWTGPMTDNIGQAAVELSKQGVSQAELADFLAKQYGIDQYAAANAAGMADAGQSAGDISNLLMTDYGPQMQGWAEAGANSGLGLSDLKNAYNAYRLANTGYGLVKALTGGTGNLKQASPLTRTTGLPSLLGGDSASTAGKGGMLPGSLEGTSLAAAPVTQGPNMNLNQLKQLYPQLSTIDPRLVQTLAGKSGSASPFSHPAEASTGTNLSAQGQGGTPSAGYPSIAAEKNANTTRFAGGSPLSGGFNALSAAGLDALAGGLPSMKTYGLKDGGQPHVPQFKTGTTGHYVQGAGDGQSDDIPAMLADGEYVFDADTVAALGNGSNKAGALQLDKMRESIRKHKRAAPHNKIPPKAKSPLEYMKGK